MMVLRWYDLLFTNIFQIVIFCHKSTAAGFICLVIGASQEWFKLAFLDNEISILAFITLQNRQISVAEVVGHKVAYFRLIATEPKFQSIILTMRDSLCFRNSVYITQDETLSIGIIFHGPILPIGSFSQPC